MKKKLAKIKYFPKNFKMTVSQPLNFSKNHTEKQITDKLNRLIEKMVMLKPEQWIWSHNRWK